MDKPVPQSNSFSLRPARLADASDINRLCIQLGYAEEVQNIQDRLSCILEDKSHFVRVAEMDDGQMAGWIHAYIVHLIETPPYVEIGGIVVYTQFRRMGIGQQLILDAENWARQNGFECIRLRSNIVRPEAHSFYPAIGYSHIKTQKCYQKMLENA